MRRDRSMTITFMDGTKVSFDFPAQRTNEAAATILMEEAVKNPFVMVEANGALFLYPVANIKSIQLSSFSTEVKAPTPRGMIRGAKVVG